MIAVKANIPPKHITTGAQYCTRVPIMGQTADNFCPILHNHYYTDKKPIQMTTQLKLQGSYDHRLHWV